MRVMIDTNVLISALLFPSSRMDQLISRITGEHQLVLSSYVVEELLRVVKRKFPSKENAIDRLLTKLPYELIYASRHPEPGLFEIRDEKDYPVLYCAIIEGIDVFVTGDKDFQPIDIERPEILTPGEFLERY